MGRKGKRTEHLKQYQGEENDDIESEVVTQLQIDEFVIAMIYCGFPEMEARKFEILNRHLPPTYKEMTEALNKLRQIFVKIARDCVDKEKKKMPKRSSVCVDGSWDHHNDGKLLVFDVICIQTKKIVDFEVEIRASQKRRGNTEVSGPALEGLAFRAILPRLMSNKNIVELIKDGDVEVESILKKSGWNILIRHDPNHLLIHFHDHFDKAVESHKNMFRGIADKVLKQLTYILYEDTEKDVKFQKILDMKNFILTKPLLKLGRSTKKQKWKYANDKDARKCLDKVIDLCFQIADTFKRGHSTCLNESFHYLKTNKKKLFHICFASNSLKLYYQQIHLLLSKTSKPLLLLRFQFHCFSQR